VVAHSARFARLIPPALFFVRSAFLTNSLELFLKAGEIFIGKFFQIDEFISSALQRSN
jgi:hypothetical protein